jgi:hypothetical protein
MAKAAGTIAWQRYDCPHCKAPKGRQCQKPAGRPAQNTHGARQELLTRADWEDCRVESVSLDDIRADLTRKGS